LASRSSLNSTLRYWNNKVNEYNSELIQLRKRRDNVKGIKSQLKSIVNCSAEDVNSKLRSITDNLTLGMNAPDKNNRVRSILTCKNEGSIDSDDKLSSADRELQNELNDLDQRINDTNTALTRAKSEVRSTKSSISAEE